MYFTAFHKSFTQHYTAVQRKTFLFLEHKGLYNICTYVQNKETVNAKLSNKCKYKKVEIRKNTQVYRVYWVWGTCPSL